MVGPGGHRGPAGLQHHHQVSGSLSVKAIAQRGAHRVGLHRVIQQLGASVDPRDVLVVAQDIGAAASLPPGPPRLQVWQMPASDKYAPNAIRRTAVSCDSSSARKGSTFKRPPGILRYDFPKRATPWSAVSTASTFRAGLRFGSLEQLTHQLIHAQRHVVDFRGVGP